MLSFLGVGKVTNVVMWLFCSSQVSRSFNALAVQSGDGIINHGCKRGTQSRSVGYCFFPRIWVDKPSKQGFSPEKAIHGRNF
jgi:hypothetical protein